MPDLKRAADLIIAVRSTVGGGREQQLTEALREIEAAIADRSTPEEDR